jgi:hypothetical protein
MGRDEPKAPGKHWSRSGRRCRRDWAALNATDPDRLAALFSTDGVRDDPHGGPVQHVRAELRDLYARIVPGTDLSFSAGPTHGSQNVIAFEFQSTTTTADGVTALAGIDVLTVNSDLLIEHLVAYYDDNDTRTMQSSTGSHDTW